MTFWTQYGHVVGFYALVIILLFVYRKKFDWQGIVGLLRTNWGVAWMQRFGEKHARWIRPLAYVGIYVSFLGMLIIVGFLFYGLWQLIVHPNAPAVLTPVLPGVKIPGSPLVFPLFKTLIALFIVIVIHEASHGIVAAAHKLKVQSSGLLVLGPIFGAFVEPDEKKLIKRPDSVQHAIYAAGPWSNILAFGVFFGLSLLLAFAVTPMMGPQGFMFDTVVPESPAAAAGLPVDVVFTATDLGETASTTAMLEDLSEKSPGDTLELVTENEKYILTLGNNPSRPGEPWIGIEGISTAYRFQQEHPWLFMIIGFVQGVLYWVFVVSLGLGLANLIPLGPVDGGRMYQLVLRKWFGKKLGDKVWGKTAVALLLLVIVLVFVPIIRALITPLLT